MLESLDTIDWQNLHHAYGAASDVPDLLRALVSNDEETRRDVMYELYGNIWHQGTVYEASSYTVPFLIELLGHESIQRKGDILRLLASIASGSSYKAVHQSALARILGEEFVQNPQYEAEMQQELGWVQQAHIAVAGAIQLYLQLLEHDDPEVRVCVSYLLLSLPEYARDSAPTLQRCLQKEKNPQVRASLLLAIAVVPYERSQEYIQVFRDIAGSEQEAFLVRMAAAIALMRSTRGSDTFSLQILQEGIEVLISSQGVKDFYDVFVGAKANLIADILEICGIHGDSKQSQNLLEDLGEEA